MSNCTKLLLLLICVITLHHSYAQTPFRPDGPRFSTAGFFKLPEQNSREAYSFNNGWLFHKGDLPQAYEAELDDSQWESVQLPHSVDIQPEFVSGSANYQGVVWYRKHFYIPDSIQSKRLVLIFEAIMGKCAIYLNGHLIKKHKGGYLPIVTPLTKSRFLHLNKENVIAIKADNSNDPSYPIGKPQYALDFTYRGGMYRDSWLVATNKIHVTNVIAADQKAGGGVRVEYADVSEEKATVNVWVNVKNEIKANKKLNLELYLKNKNGQIVADSKKPFKIEQQDDININQSLQVKKPLLWSPDHPNLYNLYVVIRNKHDEVIDGYYIRIGIKSIRLKGSKGLYLNGGPLKGKLVGANHHQSYAYIGNAVPDNLLWRDAKILRDAGIRILRLSHYPQSPSFMDACDELGIFVIVCLPGWQFWNSKNPDFERLMKRNLRQMIRLNRNHAAVFAWESVPNETRFPKEFGIAAYKIVHEEDPSRNCIASTNYGDPAWERYDLIYANPVDLKIMKKYDDKCFFDREWGDNPDDWYAQNSNSRASIAWGEYAQLIQAKHYANPPYYFDCWETIYEAPDQFIGGALWHAFDCARGYHPVSFYGGIVTAFRRPKYSYYMFKSQQNPSTPYTQKIEKQSYQLFVANAMTPFSPSDVTVYTNCDSVKLIKFGLDSVTLAPDSNLEMPHPPIVFKDAYHFMRTKNIPRPYRTPSEKVNSNGKLVFMGYANGKVVITKTQTPSARPSRISLEADLQGLKPVANGSFIIPVFARMLDKQGRVKRLNGRWIHFEVKGTGKLIGKNLPGINPRPLVWGATPALVRVTPHAGHIKIIASLSYPGMMTPKSDTLIIKTQPSKIPAIYEKKYLTRNRINQKQKGSGKSKKSKLSDEQKEKVIKEVGKQQSKFISGTDEE